VFGTVDGSAALGPLEQVFEVEDARCDRVVSDNDAADRNLRADGLKRVRVPVFLVVDQDNVEGAVGAIDRFHRVAEFVARDSVVAACSQVLAGEFEFVLVDLGEDDLAVRGKGVGDPVGGVAVARSELEDALGVAQSGDEPEERADRRANVGNPSAAAYSSISIRVSSGSGPTARTKLAISSVRTSVIRENTIASL